MAKRMAESVTQGREGWTDFLDTAARLYRYSFPDQLMIYAQRPDATACAAIEVWNHPMNRWVRRGSKGIALLDDTGDFPKLRYVFDVSDTEPAHEKAQRPFLWELRPEHHAPVLNALAKTYDEVEDSLPDALYNIASQLATEYYEDNAREIGYMAEDSFLEDYDELNLSAAFRQALTVSIAYSLMSRCGLDTDAYFADEDFFKVYDFNTPAAVTALGTAVSDLSEQVLKDIGTIIKSYERQRAAERSAEHERKDRADLQPGGGLSSARSDFRGTGIAGTGEAAGQIRQDAPQISQAAPGYVLQFPAAERRAVSPSEGDRPDGGGTSGADIDGTDREEPASRQGEGADGLGTAHEQPESPGGGTAAGRTDLHLKEKEPEEIPPEQEAPATGGISLPENEQKPVSETYSQAGNMPEEQPRPIPAALPALTDTLAGSFLSAAELDAILRDGGNGRNTLLHITAYFLKGKILEENAEFLAREYKKGGKGFQFGEKQVSVWFDDTGLTFGRGKSALFAREQLHLTWEQAADRIRALLESGQYAAPDTLDEALYNEHQELAERLLFFYRDDLRDFREMPEGWRSEKGGFPDDAAQVRELLRDKAEYGEYHLIRERLEKDIAALLAEKDPPGRRWHDPHRLLEDVRDLGIAPRSFPAGEPPVLGSLPFITEDEVDAYLIRGSSYQEGKYRILSFFLHDHTPKERADFLKKEYGHGGSSHALSGADNSWADSESGKGITLKRGGLSNPYDTVKLSWSAAEKRLDKLIRSGRYMTRRELDRIRDYEKDMLARHVTNFYYNMPQEFERPYPSSHDFFDEEGKRSVRAMLDDPEKAAGILAAMKPILAGTHEDDRYYDLRKTGYENLSAYLEGNYHLFPRIETLTAPETAAARARVTEPVTQPYTQLTLFDLPQPILPGEEAQRAVIVENQKEAAQPVPLATEYISQEEMDTLLLCAIETPERYDRLAACFAERPRSKEATQLVRELYDGAYLTDRTDGAEGYLGLLGSDTGIVFSKGDPKTVSLSQRRPAATLELSWAKVHRRVAELCQTGRFLEERERPKVFFSPERLVAYRVGDAVDARSADDILVRLEISSVSRDYVFYTLPGESEQEPVEMFRSRFEGYLDDGRFTVAEPGEKLPEPEQAETVPEEQEASKTPDETLPADAVPSEPTADAEPPPQKEPDTASSETQENPEPQQAAPSQGRSYAVGDTVYLDGDGRPYRIDHIGDYDIRLQDPSLLYPIFRAESRERFEQLLSRNPKNIAFTEYLSADLDNAHEDLRDVLENGLLPGTIGTSLLQLFSDGAPNSEVESYLKTLAGEAETMTLNTGETADYFAQPAALVIDVAGRFISRYTFAWGETVYVLRGIYEREQELFGRSVSDPVISEPVASPPQEEARPEQEPSGEPSKPEPAAQTSTDESVILTREAIEYIREQLQNPTPDAIARIEGLLAGARNTAGQQEPEAGTHGSEPPAQEILFESQAEPAETGLEAPLLPPQEAEPVTEDTAEPEITQADIEDALIRWNGSLDSKILVCQYVRENARARGTAAFLREEYGGELPAFLVTKDGAEPVNLSWPAVQKNIARLIEAGRFLTPGEEAYYNREYMDFAEEELPELDEPEQETEIPAAAVLPTANFRITDDHLGEGGQKTKFGYNLAAIRTLKQIEEEHRYATPEEQEILSRYVGWGGIPQAFDENRDGWQREYAELKELLTPEEYEMARASTLNAHYTSPTVIKAMYTALEQLGFRKGNLLEPACGVGNFFGLLPESMKNARLYGVELDSITGRIAGLLYPGADIKVTGYEQTQMPDAFFDVAVGNVPFGNYPVMDKRYRQKFHIHDYFFAKTLDQVRPGGIVAFVTSRYTMDRRNPQIRKYLAQRAELLGAVRLPNNAFKANAGTEVTADILFLQRRDRIMDIEPDWVHLGFTADGILVNRYFEEHPEMVLGKMEYDDRMYGDRRETTCSPIPGADLSGQLREAMEHIRGQLTEPELDDLEGVQDEAIPADPSVRNFSFTVADDRVYFRENSSMYPVDLPNATLDRIRGMVELRDCVHALIDLQIEEFSEADIQEKQAELNRLYDAFTAEYGLINATANSRAFSADSAYFLLSSLEVLDEDGNLDRKADMFTKRTIKQKTVVTSVDTASEALAVSIGERACVDMEFMRQLTGFTKERLVSDLTGVIFRDLGDQPPETIPKAFYDPEKLPFVTADEYLSGNVRDKLRLAKALAEMRPDLAEALAPNIEALEKAQPKDLDASEISVRLGSTWVDKEYIQQFMLELLQPSYNLRNNLKVNYFPYTGEWQVAGKGRVPYNNILATVTYGTERMNAYQILDDTLNLRDVRVYDTKYEDGKEKRVLNKKETTLAQQKQEALKQAFKDWIWKDARRRQELVHLYNDRFNSTRLREYDGSHINFSGISPEITLRSHQLNAIAHILYGGNTLLAHEVGAGKTFEMVAAAMECKRLGLCQKSLFAVPNHLTEQWASEFLRLYPSANLLVATKKDFEMRNRKKFCAKISTGDYDAVIIGHSQLEKIPMSAERQERLLREQIDEVMDGIDELKRSHGENFSIKQLEKTRKSLEARLKNLLEGKRRDDVVTFEQLGVDRLFVDESHFFKNLFLHTKMRNVAGLSTSDALKSSDLFMKCRYMDELTGGKGIIFATGTPISNSMTEMYTIQRYLQYDLLEKKNLTHFDAWASTFGETVTAIELAPEGTGYRARTRFSKFHNLPELMAMFKEVADIKTADTLDLPRPEAHYETVVVKPSQLQQEMVKELSDRAAAVHANLVDPTVDNMLKITSDGRKIGLDQRLMNPMLPDDEDSKVNACTEKIYRIWRDSKSSRLTQLAFCDFSTPNKDGRFNVYDDIRDKLAARGIPSGEMAFIHEANTEARKKELFAKVRQGKVRVLFGSTFKMGAGTNVQDRLYALHDLDCPWRPSDLEQRAGRIVRQGNNNPAVYIYRYATEGTFDAYLWQTVENKQKFISQIMTSKSPVRACEDVDETALSYAEIKALCAGNPLIKEKIDLDIEVARLRLLRADHQSQHYRLEDDLLKYYPESIEAAKGRITGAGKDLERYNANLPKAPAAVPEASSPQADMAEGTAPAPPPFPTMTVLGTAYTEKETAAKALLEACKTVTGKEAVKIGSYLGFDLNLSFDSFYKKFNLTMKGELSYSVELGTDTFGNMSRINNTLRTEIPERITSSKNQLESLYQQVEDAKKELQNPFAQEQELTNKETRLAFLNAQLNIDSAPEPVTEPEQTQLRQVAYAKDAKPSILENLRSGTNGGKNRETQDKAKGHDITM
ncbi:RNA polymerase-associated protein RapA [Oxobacter pfennigii]|uniref:RNA polymerase-associated protein RapA n=2 Tax=Oxobacter pfennigii TaxID=36849 RepID=A0A0P9AHX7_9CLOT|nr:RNA polymerase-associated protein RapA [Oxobacter pfennigii]